MKLARSKGKTIDELFAAISETELIYEAAYNHIDPFGEDRADLRMAIATSSICNSNNCKTTIKDFLPNFNREENEEMNLQLYKDAMLGMGEFAAKNVKEKEKKNRQSPK